MTKLAFCANCQTEKEHLASIADNGDLVLTCDCGRALKFPSSFDAEDLANALETHKGANEGQITKEGQLAKFGLNEDEKPAKKAA